MALEQVEPLVVLVQLEQLVIRVLKVLLAQLVNQVPQDNRVPLDSKVTKVH